jgi:hypothetical protein
VTNAITGLQRAALRVQSTLQEGRGHETASLPVPPPEPCCLCERKSIAKVFIYVYFTQSYSTTSAEIYVVCQGYLNPKKIDPRLLDPKHVFKVPFFLHNTYIHTHRYSVIYISPQYFLHSHLATASRDREEARGFAQAPDWSTLLHLPADLPLLLQFISAAPLYLPFPHACVEEREATAGGLRRRAAAAFQALLCGRLRRDQQSAVTARHTQRVCLRREGSIVNVLCCLYVFHFRNLHAQQVPVPVAVYLSR